MSEAAPHSERIQFEARVDPELLRKQRWAGLVPLLFVSFHLPSADPWMGLAGSGRCCARGVYARLARASQSGRRRAADYGPAPSRPLREYWARARGKHARGHPDDPRVRARIDRGQRGSRNRRCISDSCLPRASARRRTALCAPSWSARSEYRSRREKQRSMLRRGWCEGRSSREAERSRALQLASIRAASFFGATRR